VLAGSYTVVEQRHARLVQFRRQWAHKIECRIAGREAATGLPSGIWTPDWLLTCDDREHWTGMATTVVRQRVAWRETLDAAWHRAGRASLPPRWACDSAIRVCPQLWPVLAIILF